MPNNSLKTIVVAGDVTIDWLALPVPAVEGKYRTGEPPPNYELYPGTRMVATEGGALLLARFVSVATGERILAQQLDGPKENIPPNEVIHSIVELDGFPCSAEDRGKKVYRLRRFLGFCGPYTAAPRRLTVVGDRADADIVVLDDAANGFRDAQDLWPAALRVQGRRPLVIYKMSRPLVEGRLWESVKERHADRLVVVMSADDLRSLANISRRLSWERTARDFVWEMASNGKLKPLTECAHLVVRFGVDGAIHYRKGQGPGLGEFGLYYDPAVIEDGFRDECPGHMLGFTAAFVAAVTARVAKDGDLSGVGEGVRDGILSMQRLFRLGFGTASGDQSLDHLDYPGKEIFHATSHKERPIADITVPHPTAAESADPDYWRILKHLTGTRLEDVAFDIVERGEIAALTSVPFGRFGELKTVDRAEIESFSSIRNLIREYLDDENPKRPLSIAVFGPPGSGKSFGVTAVAESISRDKVRREEFNVAQFGSPADLARALHKVRDVSLSGKIPLVFFDEFDSELGGTSLGWLKYFLAPMQDGKFRDGETMHPIGKAIFVFAGGTSTSFQEFCRQGRLDAVGDFAAATDSTGVKPDLSDTFKGAKVPDFVSRLRGYVNILGPNPLSGEDYFALIRRAMLLRSLLLRNKKARGLFDREKRARIDRGVLRALIKVPWYRHGARSMEAILDMSMLADRTRFEQALLPSKEQLDLHTDAEMFYRLLVQDVLFGAARESLAQAIHERFCETQKGEKSENDPSIQPWDQLPHDYRESNRQQADDIPRKLRAIDHGFSPVLGRQPILVGLPQEEIEKLAELEHERWVQERFLARWRLGPYDPANRTNPALVPWGQLGEDAKEKDRRAVRDIPLVLARAGFEIYPLGGGQTQPIGSDNTSVAASRLGATV